MSCPTHTCRFRCWKKRTDSSQQASATMRMTMLQYASSVAAVGMLALGLVIGSFAQIQAGERGPIQMSQYCAPPQEDTEAPKFYFRQHGNARRNTGRASILADALLLL